MSTAIASFYYDSLGRVVEESQTYSGNTRNVTHHAWSKMAIGFTFPQNRQITNTYDALYRRSLVEETDGGADIAAWEFFGQSRVAEVRLANGLIQTMLNNSRTRSMVQDGQLSPDWGDDSSDRLGYDGAGRMIAKRYLSGGINGSTHAYEDPTAFVGFTTEFDRASNKLYERHLHAESRSHLYPQYDSPNRLRMYQRGTLAEGGESIATPISLPDTNTEQSYDLDGLDLSIGSFAGCLTGAGLADTLDVSDLNKFVLLGLTPESIRAAVGSFVGTALKKTGGGC